MTEAERRLQSLLRLWTGLFAAGAVSFAVTPDLTVATLNLIPGPSVPSQGERFWNTLSVSLMATLTALCGIASTDVRRHRPLVTAVMVGKATSSGLYLLRFLRGPRHPAHLAGALCDGAILGMTASAYLAARESA